MERLIGGFEVPDKETAEDKSQLSLHSTADVCGTVLKAVGTSRSRGGSLGPDRRWRRFGGSRNGGSKTAREVLGNIAPLPT
jgi:hypothetical protein